MGLLRAAADVVLIGSGTLQASPSGLWTPESTFPDLAQEWTDLRKALAKPAVPALAVLSGSGGVDVTHPAFARGALVLTTDAGAELLKGRLPEASEAVSLGGGPLVDVGRALEVLRERGGELVAAEVGPHVFGSMLRERLVDELLLTLSPVLGGRLEGETRFGMVEGAELLPDVRIGGPLLGARRSGAHLFLHYEIAAAT
jgi:riboflavin biosynthesis pyrimidine reductase